MDEMVKDVNGQILHDGVEVRKRWAEYFAHVLKSNSLAGLAKFSLAGPDDRETNITVVGNWRMLVLGDLNEGAISL